jgi:hypothetical protein
MELANSLALYELKNNAILWEKKIWFSAEGNGTEGLEPYLELQVDGNLVVYDKYKNPLWSAGTFGQGTKPYRLAMQNDGNVVLYDKDWKVLWNTQTWGRN